MASRTARSPQKKSPPKTKAASAGSSVKPTKQIAKVQELDNFSPDAEREAAVAGASKALGRSVRTSRSSFPVGQGTDSLIKGLFQGYAKLGYFLPWQALDYIELLATYNPDYSQAVDNVRTLANSGHELIVEATGVRKAKDLKSRIEEKARTIQESHGGIDGLIDKLLDQAATYGACCGEFILSEDLKDVVDFADINPKYIRFFWDEKIQRWAPFQKVSSKQAREAEKNGQEVRSMSYVRLNEITFHYYAFDAAPGSPYGTPPFLSALGPIAIQQDMVENMAQIVKKIGLLGMVDLSIERLSKAPQESIENYTLRAEQFLDQYVEVLQGMVRDGGMAHFDDVKVEAFNISGNAAGATNIFKQNEEQVFSGLKSQPSVQGRSYSSTETYAGVAYEIIIRNTFKYQRAVKRIIESGYWLMASVWGETPTKISVSFKKNKTLQRLQEATAQQIEIENALEKWRIGAHDQLGALQELGHALPKKEYSSYEDLPKKDKSNSKPKDDPKDDSDPEKEDEDAGK